MMVSACLYNICNSNLSCLFLSYSWGVFTSSSLHLGLHLLSNPSRSVTNCNVIRYVKPVFIERVWDETRNEREYWTETTRFSITSVDAEMRNYFLTANLTPSYEYVKRSFQLMRLCKQCKHTHTRIEILLTQYNNNDWTLVIIL